MNITALKNGMNSPKVKKALTLSSVIWSSCLIVIILFAHSFSPFILILLAAFSTIPLGLFITKSTEATLLENERIEEQRERGGRTVAGVPPKRDAFESITQSNIAQGKKMIDRYLVGFDLNTGDPLWVTDNEICGHGCVFAKTGVGKTLWLESLMFQQMLRGRASGCTFIDAKRDASTLAHVILMAILSGRLEDLIIIDPFDPIHSYNFTLTHQRSDVKARKVLRAGLPPTSDQSVTKHYDRLAADSIYRLVRAIESTGFGWSIRDVAVALSSFHLAYPKLQFLLEQRGATKALIELGHLASSYRTTKGSLDSARMTENLRGIASELHAIANSEMGQIFCARTSDLTLTDAIVRGKIIYFMLPRLEEAESAARMVKLFREDLEVSIGEITSSRALTLEDPHLVIIDEGSSTFGPTWANLFELARKGRFALLFGAQSTGALTDRSLGLSESFYERVMANVNLKVMMRVGDNRTAEDMAQWIGKAKGEKRDTQISHQSFSQVDADALKHDMSAEKGLAWFDLGDGRIVKGRSFWFDAEIPEGWDSRRLVPRYDGSGDRYGGDSLGLADWIDKEILRQERGQRETPKESVKEEAPQNPSVPDEEIQGLSETFRITHKGKGKGFVSSFFRRDKTGRSE